MTAVGTRRVTGHITIVQEERFRLIDDTGRGYLFTLAHNANVTAEDLHRCRRHGAYVHVHYDGQPDLASAIAHSVKVLLDPHPAALEQAP